MRVLYDEFSAVTLAFSRWPGFVLSRTVGLALPYTWPARISKSAEDRGFLCLCITGSISLIGNAAKRNACATGFSRLNRPHDIDKRHSPLLPGLFRISGPYGRAHRAAGAAPRHNAAAQECGNGAVKACLYRSGKARIFDGRLFPEMLLTSRH